MKKIVGYGMLSFAILCTANIQNVKADSCVEQCEKPRKEKCPKDHKKRIQGSACKNQVHHDCIKQCSK